MPESAILPGEPFTPEETERLISRFRREGYCDLGQVPAHVWDGASPRLQRMLGRHAKGAYG